MLFCSKHKNRSPRDTKKKRFLKGETSFISKKLTRIPKVMANEIGTIILKKRSFYTFLLLPYNTHLLYTKATLNEKQPIQIENRNHRG
jgi:hypothetical protein